MKLEPKNKSMDCPACGSVIYIHRLILNKGCKPNDSKLVKMVYKCNNSVCTLEEVEVRDE